MKKNETRRSTSPPLPKHQTIKSQEPIDTSKYKRERTTSGSAAITTNPKLENPTLIPTTTMHIQFLQQRLLPVLNSIAYVLQQLHNGALHGQIVLHFLIQLRRQHRLLKMHTIRKHKPEPLRRGLCIPYLTYVDNLQETSTVRPTNTPLQLHISIPFQTQPQADP